MVFRVHGADTVRKLQNWTFITWLPAVVHPSRRDHPVSELGWGTHWNAVLVSQTKCYILSAAQTLLFGAEKVCCHVVWRVYLFASSPTPEWLFLVSDMHSSVIPLPLHLHHFCEKVELQGNQHIIKGLRLKEEIQKEDGMWNSFTGSNFDIELSNQNDREQHFHEVVLFFRRLCSPRDV